jgi:hypothetical protein
MDVSIFTATQAECCHLRELEHQSFAAITAGNTNAPTITIGEKITDLIKASRTQ